MTTDTNVFFKYIEICSIHASRLRMALNKTVDLFPIRPDRLESLSEEELGYLEILTSRFAKLQDAMGTKIFPRLMPHLVGSSEPRTFIDILNLMEKYDLIPSRQFWEEMRDVRNHIAHEYPDNPSLMAQNLNEASIKAKMLVDYWDTLKSEIEKLAKGL